MKFIIMKFIVYVFRVVANKQGSGAGPARNCMVLVQECTAVFMNVAKWKRKMVAQ